MPSACASPGCSPWNELSAVVVGASVVVVEVVVEVLGAVVGAVVAADVSEPAGSEQAATMSTKASWTAKSADARRERVTPEA